MEVGSRANSLLPERNKQNELRRINVLGVGVSVLNINEAVELIFGAIRTKKKGYICVTGVHGVSEAQTDAEFRRILNRAFLCTPDGMPLVWIGRLQGHKQMDRVYGPDLMNEVFEKGQEQGLTHFFYGGQAGVAERLREALLLKYPKARIVGLYTPPFRELTSDEEQELISKVRTTKPDIVWVGLSTPKQEKFMAKYINRLDTTLMIGVGAAFDFLSGRVKQAPRWVQRAGLEWFYRMCMEPKRLMPRYLKNNPMFVLRIICQFSGVKKYKIDEG